MSAEEFDYVIVGGGSAGCVLAGILSQSRAVRVALIEAGDPAEAHPETFRADGYKDAFANDALVWERFSTPQSASAGKRFFMGTGKGLGGSGAINGMVYTRGARADYDEWPAGWRFADLVPAFEQIESALRVRPRPPTAFTEAFVAAAEEAGFRRTENLNDGDLSGVIGYETMNYEGEQRRNSYVAFLKAAEGRENLRVYPRTRARRVMFEDKRAVGVEVEDAAGVRVLAARREVVLSAGALETPKLLLLSGVGNASALRELGIEVVLDLKAVGQNLHDHPNVPLFFRGERPVDVNYPQLYGFHRANPDSDFPRGQSDTCYVMYPARSSLREAAMRMLPTKLPAALYGDTAKGLIRAGVAFATRFGAAQRMIEKTWGVVVILGKPKSRGTLTLLSPDPNVEARLDPAYFSCAEDLTTMVRGVALARRIAAGQSLRAFGNTALMPSANLTRDEDVAEFICENAITTFHFAGTCRMGEDAGSVVTPELLVRGLTGLRVADASVMPSTPVSALNAPSMMIAARAAAFAEKAWRVPALDVPAAEAEWRA